MPSQGMFYEDLIEEYLCNRLNAFQRTQLEEALQRDADLLFDYRWQRDIIQCIQLYRKQQLRHRLSRVSC